MWEKTHLIDEGSGTVRAVSRFFEGEVAPMAAGMQQLQMLQVVRNEIVRFDPDGEHTGYSHQHAFSKRAHSSARCTGHALALSTGNSKHLCAALMTPCGSRLHCQLTAGI